MITHSIATKLVVRDVAAQEQFYRAIGLKLVSSNIGGEGDVRQQQSWLSTTGDTNAHVLILTQFLELPSQPTPPYPGEMWLAFNVDDVDATVRDVAAAGGTVVRPGADQPDWAVRAAVVNDPEGHIIELVGPMLAG